MSIWRQSKARIICPLLKNIYEITTEKLNIGREKTALYSSDERGETMTKKGMTPQKAAKIRASKGLASTKLQRLRVAKKYSQNDLAEISGISARRIQHYEQRVRPIDSARLDTLCRLCIALECKIEDIIENKDLAEKIKMVK